ncbi:hypothetical protein MASR1M12_40930 [Erysipelotrichia bacterium]
MPRQIFLEELASLVNVESSELNFDTSLDDLEEWDSMTSLSLAAMLDDKFKIFLSAEQISGCKTVGDLVKVFEAKLSEK